MCSDGRQCNAEPVCYLLLCQSARRKIKDLALPSRYAHVVGDRYIPNPAITATLTTRDLTSAKLRAC